MILVALPILLRGERHLGRWGALTASTLFLISPALLYQSRYIRHDIFTVVGSLVLFIAIMRYIERPSRGWLIAIGATLGFLLTNHEIVFGIAAIFFAVIAGALLWGRLRVAGSPAAGVRHRGDRAGGALAGRRGPAAAVHSLEIAHAERAVRLLSGSAHPSADDRPGPAGDRDACRGGVARAPPARSGSDATRGGRRSSSEIQPPGSVAAAVRAAWVDRAGVSAALIAGLVIFAALFTTLFTNLYGLASGTIATDGTLLYWLGQHDFRRGEQPWFYYLLLMPQYEFIAVLFGVAATIVAGVRALLVGIGRATPGPRFVFQTFLAIWFIGIFLALSWAGEKMPWLVIHIALPATLLAAALLGEAWERWRPVAESPSDLRLARSDLRAPGWAAPQWALFALLLGLAACWFLVAAPMTYGEFVSATVSGGWERALTRGRGSAGGCWRCRLSPGASRSPWCGCGAGRVWPRSRRWPRSCWCWPWRRCTSPGGWSTRRVTFPRTCSSTPRPPPICTAW